MGKSKISVDAPSSQKYGVPFYGASWVPYKHIRSPPKQEEDVKADDRKEGSVAETATGDYVVLSGGGGEGRSGIPNAVVLARYDFATNSLSADPVAKHKTGSDLPYRMAVHPRGDGLICAMPKDCSYLWMLSLRA